MNGLPVVLNVQGRRCVIVGGGPVAVRRAAALKEAGAHVTVIAATLDPDLAKLVTKAEERPYRRGDLNGALLVVIATDDPAVNDAVTRDARDAGVLVNRADDASVGDLAIPAHAHHGPITLAVHTGGASPTAAAAIRRELSEALDPDWVTLLQIAAPYRTAIQQQQANQRQRQNRLRQLTGPDALATLKQQGPEALRQYCEQVTADLARRD